MEEMRAVVSGISLTPCSSPGDSSQVSYHTLGCTLALGLISESAYSLNTVTFTLIAQEHFRGSLLQ